MQFDRWTRLRMVCFLALMGLGGAQVGCNVAVIGARHDAAVGPSVDGGEQDTDAEVDQPDAAATCPNAICDPGEDCGSCPEDCGDCCGNTICEADEDCGSCPEDCGNCCGNAICEADEDCSSCPEDCVCPSICGDGVCSPDETCLSCEQDCTFTPNCGNGSCTAPEDCASCPQDCPACAPVVLVNDPLPGGFTVTGWNSRLEYDLGWGVDCGSLEFDLTNFDPATQFVPVLGDRYTNIVGLYEGSHGDFTQAGNLCEAVIALQAQDEIPFEWRNNKIKMKGGNYKCCGATVLEGQYTGGIGVANQFTWDVNYTYHVRLDWHGGRVLLQFDTRVVDHDWIWASDDPDPTLNFRYIFIGRDKHFAGGWLDGITISNVVIEACN